MATEKTTMEKPKWITLHFDSGKLKYPKPITLEFKLQPKALKSNPIFINKL